MEKRNFSVKVVVSVLTQRRFCESQEEFYSLLEYLLDEPAIFSTQRNSAMAICANAIAIQVRELQQVDPKSSTDLLLLTIDGLEKQYPDGIALQKVEKGSYNLKGIIDGYISMVDPEENLECPN